VDKLGKQYVIYIREEGLNWLWGWYIVKIAKTEERGKEIVDGLNVLAQVALLEWEPGGEPLPTKLYFRWPVNTRVLFQSRIRKLEIY